MTTEDVCIVCGRDYDWHEMNQPHHKFAREGDDAALAQLGPRKDEPRRRSGSTKANAYAHKLLPGLPSDPTLRILLMRKGLITPDELSQTEEEIRHTREEGGIVIVSAIPEKPDGSAEPDLRSRDGSSS